MKISNLDNEIFLDRNAIRLQIIKQIQNTLGLVDVDLTKSSFLSYVINILSTLTSNILFYQISVYKEFFLTKAQLNSSVMNGAASIGYTSEKANYAKLSLILTFPFTFTANQINYEIPKGSTFSIDNIKFITDYTLKFVVSGNTNVQCYKYYDGRSEVVPVVVSIDLPHTNEFSVMINVNQLEIYKVSHPVKQQHLEYKFTEYPIKTNGQITKIKVSVENPTTNTSEIYEQYSSVYLMSSETRGFVVRRTDAGHMLYFGNGLMGKQPEAGSTIHVEAYITLGEAGNVIAGVVHATPTIHGTTDTGETELVNYSVINPTPAINGKNEPTLEEIKYLAIDNLTSLHRLVSENDYNNVGELVPDSPLARNTYPVLKRSDVRTNEIQLFQLLTYRYMIDNSFIDAIVPTENIYLEFDSTSSFTIEKYSTVTVNSVEYIIPFELNVDIDLEITRYKYITNTTRYNLSMVLETVFLDRYVFYAQHLLVSTSNNTIHLKLFYQTEETDVNEIICEMSIYNTLLVLPMNQNLSENCFELDITPYEQLPENNNKYYFTFTHNSLGTGGSSQLLKQYSVDFTFRKRLDHIMLSNTFIDGAKVSVYDIPVIRKDFYDNLPHPEEFEYYTIQRLIDNVEMKKMRMITDFVNLKFANTSYKLKNMLLNLETRLPIDFIDLDAFEHPPITGERFIISGTETPIWSDKKGYIAICTKGADSTSAEEWSYVQPEMDDIIYAKNTEKKYLYTSCEWIEPVFEIPLLIEADVRMQDNFTIDKQKFIDGIKDEILAQYSDRMVCQSELNRSELISTIQQVDGVDHCRLIQPVSNIFYNFELTDLSNDELLHYTPELLYFKKENISIRLVQ